MKNKSLMVLGAISLAFIYYSVTFFQSPKFNDWVNEMDELSHKSNGYVFTSKEQCKVQESQLQLSCDNVFKIAESKATNVESNTEDLSVCKKFYDKNCRVGKDGKLEIAIAGAIYLDSSVPQIAPLFNSPYFGEIILPSGCITKRSDAVFEFINAYRTEFSLLNWSDLNQEIRIPKGKTSKVYVLHDYIQLRKKTDLDSRMSSCLDHIRRTI